MDTLVTAPVSITLQTATSLADWVIVLPIVLGLMGAAALLVIGRHGRLSFAVAAAVILAIIACDAALVVRVAGQGPLSMTMGNWLPPFGISLTADIFSAGFALTAAIVALAVLVYAQTDTELAQGRSGFYPLILLLLAGVSGAFLTGDLFNLYVWFEVTLIASFGLLVQGARPLQLDGAVKYGFLNFLATTLFLLALGLIYGLLGTLNMGDILRVAPLANPGALAGVAAILLLAFGMKAAAFPLNAWLPASYHTPPVAISALFAGLLTKVGAYALLRVFAAVLPGSRDMLEPVLVALAVATLLLAPLGAIAETHLRRAMGFFVIGGIGAVMAGLAIATPDAIAGAGLYIFHAMLAMSALYMVAGLIERRTGATDTREMGGIYAASAPLSILFLLLVLAAAGVPPLLGFWPKLLLLDAGLSRGFAGGEASWTSLAVAFALLANAVLTLIAGARLWAHVFWRSGPEGETSEHSVRSLAPMDSAARLGLIVTAALATLVVLAGLWPAPVMEAARLGAADIADPARYLAATGLAGDLP